MKFYLLTHKYILLLITYVRYDNFFSNSYPFNSQLILKEFFKQKKFNIQCKTIIMFKMAVIKKMH